MCLFGIISVRGSTFIPIDNWDGTGRTTLRPDLGAEQFWIIQEASRSPHYRILFVCFASLACGVAGPMGREAERKQNTDFQEKIKALG